MALEDIAMLRAVHGSTVLVTSDANQTAALVAGDGSTDRASSTCARCAWPRPCIYSPDERFPIGGSRVLRSSDARPGDAARRRRHRARGARRRRHRSPQTGVRARVIDLYSVKPLDTNTLIEAAEATGHVIVTVEDHWPQGGLGDAVLETLADADSDARIRRLAVHTMPTSGRPEELLWRGWHRPDLDRDRRPRPTRADPGAQRSPSRPRTRPDAGSMNPGPPQDAIGALPAPRALPSPARDHVLAPSSSLLGG